mmetsp:Transcript_5764/g.9986  ORF Transcript_5764/g.9986 Transcript_5764/m.9986 type:complete len:190 (-) Transcript_5764:266-835(-)|eukprot:CAMPEP_0197436780 /NCGR_PEP_ID=MMETSP1175-20131217/4182_1 /TAXON_ID=1003142 /ORGANISM="Triceratium dubium, Strain CCMP147" /LENGTH=189 /DNA_ID=CAMNT_0042966161 /DNA_START=108 /DNA_END=677 /DNA_ORIENTATION=+
MTDLNIAVKVRPFSNTFQASQFDSEQKLREKKRLRTAEEKKIDRIMANRRSAKESRERRKKLMENLESTVETLTKENEALARENEKLRAELSTLMAVHVQGQNIQQQAPAVPSTTPGLFHLGRHGIPQLQGVPQIHQAQPRMSLQQELNLNGLNIANGANRNLLAALAATQQITPMSGQNFASSQSTHR